MRPEEKKLYDDCCEKGELLLAQMNSTRAWELYHHAPKPREPEDRATITIDAVREGIEEMVEMEKRPANMPNVAGLPGKIGQSNVIKELKQDLAELRQMYYNAEKVVAANETQHKK